AEQDPAKLSQAYNEAVKELAVLRSSTVVNQLYGGSRLTVERHPYQRRYVSEDTRHFDDASKVEITFNFMSTASASESECHPPGCNTLEVSANVFYIMIRGRKRTCCITEACCCILNLGLR
ncbi:hypothetical protein P692DRAFT_20750450, partial [Suillus brevipes Sb2]